MKTHLPPSLRAGLLACLCALPIVGTTIASSASAAFTDIKYELKPIVPPSTSANDFVVNIPNAPDITNAIEANLVFDGAIGDDITTPLPGITPTTGYFKWEIIDNIPYLDFASPGDADIDITINSLNNVFVDTNDATFTGTEINHSIFEIEPKQGNIILRRPTPAISHTNAAKEIDIYGDVVGIGGTLQAGSVDELNFQPLAGVAIYNEQSIHILDGDLVGNIGAMIFWGMEFQNTPLAGTVQGGGLHNAGKVEKLNSDFIGNMVDAALVILNDENQEFTYGTELMPIILLQGAGLYNADTVNEVTSDFIGNTLNIDEIIFDGASSTPRPDNSIIDESLARDWKAQGAGIYNAGTIVSMESSFIGNKIVIGNMSLVSAPDPLSTSASFTDIAKGAAVYNDGGKLTFLALTGNRFITDNSIIDKNGEAISSGIYNAGTAAKAAQINFNAYGSNSYIVNDTIIGNVGAAEHQIIHINNGLDSNGDAINAQGSDFSMVIFNNLVNDQTIYVHDGFLVLNEYNGASAMLESVDMTVHSDGQLLTLANYLGSSSEIDNDGNVIIAGGLLSNAINGDGTTNIFGYTESHADLLGNKIFIQANMILKLTGGTIAKKVYGSGGLDIAENVITVADNLEVESNVYTDKELQLNGGTLGAKVAGSGAARILANMESSADYLATDVFINESVLLTLTTGTLAKSASGAGSIRVKGTVNFSASNYHTGGTHLGEGDRVNIVENHQHSITGDGLRMDGGHSSLTRVHVTEGSGLGINESSTINLYATDNDPAAAGFSWTIISWVDGAEVLALQELINSTMVNDTSVENSGFEIVMGEDQFSYILVDGTDTPVDPPIDPPVDPPVDPPTELAGMPMTHNGRAGVNLMNAVTAVNHPAGPDLQGVLDTINEIYAESGGVTVESDDLASALAGAGVTSIGSSMMSNMQGQLRNMRNRTETFTPVGEGGFWISAEGSHYELDSVSTAAGHSIDNWGGSVGGQIGLSKSNCLNFAITSLYGDFEADSTDLAEGDMDTVFVSLAVLHKSGNWTHQFVASYGHTRTDINRTVIHRNGSYSTEGNTKGYSLGFMYELGYEYSLSENTTWSPIFNASISHIYADGYTERGSDAAVDVGEQEKTYPILAVGARVDTTLDFGLQLSARALINVDLGSREQEVEVQLRDAYDTYGHLRGADAGVLGFELGVGASLPVGESGAVFMNASGEIREDQQNVNGSVGYQIRF